jgi:alkane 1-monooxygenase
VPLVFVAAALGGWWFLLIPLRGMVADGCLDLMIGLYSENADPLTPEGPEPGIVLRDDDLGAGADRDDLRADLVRADRRHALGGGRRSASSSASVCSPGTVGITYSHELMHQKNRLERC